MLKLFTKPLARIMYIMWYEITICPLLALCDFQYLTLDENEEGNLQCYYDEIVPIGLPSASWMGYLFRNQTLLIFIIN